MLSIEYTINNNSKRASTLSWTKITEGEELREVMEESKNTDENWFKTLEEWVDWSRKEMMHKSSHRLLQTGINN